MILRTKLYSSFVQYGDTCILGSYAIVSNYYIGVPILDLFKDFCKHYDINTEENDFALYFSKHFITSSLNKTQRLATWLKLTELNKYEIAYDNFFHREYNSRNISGLNLMKEIHDTSRQSSFNSSRNLFSLSYISSVMNDIGNVNDCLACEESLLIVAFQGDRVGRHISIVGHDSNGFYMIETRPNTINGAVGISNITSLPDVGDALLARKVNDKGKSNC